MNLGAVNTDYLRWRPHRIWSHCDVDYARETRKSHDIYASFVWLSNTDHFLYSGQTSQPTPTQYLPRYKNSRPPGYSCLLYGN
jgi:hypothetical protein